MKEVRSEEIAEV